MKTKIIKNTPFGSVAIIWSKIEGSPKIVRIIIPKLDSSAEEQVFEFSPHSHESSTRKIDEVARDIKAFLEGEDVRISLDTIDLESCPPFQRAVLHAEYQIPRGYISTYKLIAKHVGNEKGARAVGNALANNPFPIIVPCHRAIRSDGHLGGFQGGLEMKKALLENEGIIINDKGFVVSKSRQIFLE